MWRDLKNHNLGVFQKLSCEIVKYHRMMCTECHLISKSHPIFPSIPLKHTWLTFDDITLTFESNLCSFNLLCPSRIISILHVCILGTIYCLNTSPYVMVYGAPKVGHNLEEANKRIMSSFCLHNLQCHEKSYHLDSIKVYLKGMYLFVIENWTPNDR